MDNVARRQSVKSGLSLAACGAMPGAAFAAMGPTDTISSDEHVFPGSVRKLTPSASDFT